MNAFRKAHRDEATSDSQLLTNLSNLADVVKRTKEQAGKLEVRCIDQLPPWTIIATNPHHQTGHMYVRLSSFRVLNKLRPTFELTKAKDAQLFEFFVEQFETVWEDAEIIDLENHMRNFKS